MADEDGIQSDSAAEKLRDELKTIITELLKGNYAPVTAKLNEYAREAPRFSVRPIGASKVRMVDSLNARFRKIRINKGRAYFVEEQPDRATADQVVYGLLRRSLESGDIERLALCEKSKCGKLFYRKSLKSSFCSTQCRWDFHNHSERRKSQREKGHWIKKKDLRLRGGENGNQ